MLNTNFEIVLISICMWINLSRCNSLYRNLLRNMNVGLNSVSAISVIWWRTHWLTHWGRVTYLYASVNYPSLVQIMACAWTAPSHYLNQYWNVADCTLRNKLQWSFIRNSNIFIKKMHLKMSYAKWRSFCLGLNMLKMSQCGIATCNPHDFKENFHH